MGENKSPEKRVSKENLKKIFDIVREWDADQLEAAKTFAEGMPFKTVNGESIRGDGNIVIDTSLYVIVTSLPASSIKDDKIYLVPLVDGSGDTRYAEYVHTSGGWEKLGDFRPGVDLADYAKKEELPVFESFTDAEIDAAAEEAKALHLE